MEKGSTAKEVFLKELYGLDEPDNSQGDVHELLNTVRASKPAQRSIDTSQSSNRRNRTSSHVKPLARTVSAPQANTEVPKASLIAPLHEARHPADTPSLTTNEGHQSKKGTSKMPSTASKKRKRGRSLDRLPGPQQIFGDLRFYFIPNDDVAPARKLRIRKALERGATWIKQWDDGITHVVVDKSLSYSDILKFLKVPSIPSSMILVNEHYPAECIQFQALVNPNQRRYHVRGYQEKPELEPKKTVDTSSPKSLPLKPAKEHMDQTTETPSRTEPSVPSSMDGLVAEQTTPLTPNDQTSDTLRLHKRQLDALDKAIEETLAVKDLPLDDDDEDDTTSATSSMVIDSDDERVSKASRSRLPTSRPWQAKFTCMDKHTSNDHESNPNARTVEILQQMCDYYSRTHDHWRTLAYRKAISALKNQPHRITTKEAAAAIPNIGDRLAAKIEEIAFTDRLRRLDNTSLDDRDRALQLFLKIYGVGPAQATQWIDQGHRNLADLLSSPSTSSSLTKTKRISIAHIDDFAARIPRAEVERHAKIVRAAFSHVDPAIELTVGGSYRRGSPDSGDVDFIVTKPRAGLETLRTLVCDSVIPRLFAQNYLKAALAATSSRASSSGSKWHGCACLPGGSGTTPQPWRRIDFLFVPYEELGAALIYFTGNDIFNRSIRLLASKKGFRLNQRGLWKDVLREKGRERITQGTLVEGRNERRIFEILEVPWRPPHHRLC